MTDSTSNSNSMEQFLKKISPLKVSFSASKSLSPFQRLNRSACGIYTVVLKSVFKRPLSSREMKEILLLHCSHPRAGASLLPSPALSTWSPRAGRRPSENHLPVEHEPARRGCVEHRGG